MKEKILLTLVFGIFLIGIVSAVGEISYCCEKTTDGAWCQNAPESACSDSFRKTPTSCEATSYCRLGCCYDSQEGTCMENTPQKVCEESNGVWEDDAECDIPQCSLGCCLIGDQAAFVTQTRCKRLASIYGLKIDFRTDMQNEVQCIASAASAEKGACVFEEDYSKTCLFITKAECLEKGASVVNVENSSVSFHAGYLCSAEELGTECGPTTKTTCVDGRDEAYFLDSCGNLANIYDASRIDDKTYWSKVVLKEESCGAGSSNSNSKSCGNCDYYLGSVCKEFEVGKDSTRPSYGNSICRDLNCEYDGKAYQHGETWCADAKATSEIVVGSGSSYNNFNKENLPGSRYFRLICYNGEVTVEPCADFRSEVCLQSDVNGFKTAGCRVNLWQDCYSQDNQKDCENADKRDCQWIVGKSILKDEDGNSKAEDSDGNIIDASCVPLFAPGFNFWEEGDAEGICSLASTTCVVEYEKKLFGEKKCKKNCDCLTEAWEIEMNNFCISLGDCGSKVNYIGIEGYNNDSAVRVRDEDEVGNETESS